METNGGYKVQIIGPFLLAP
jgi:hypothetical protein